MSTTAMMSMYSFVVLRWWPFAALCIGFPGFLYLIRKCSTSTNSVPLLIEWQALALAIYMIHQFEEHGYDLYGRRFQFQVFVCQEMGFGMEKLDSCPASEEFILVVNVIGIWCSGLMAMATCETYPVAGLSFFAIPFVNSFVHIRPALKNTIYTPGLATSVLMLLPISCWYYQHMLKSGIVTPPEVAAALLSGALIRTIMFVSILAVMHNRLSQAPFLVIQGLLAFIPSLTGIVMKQRRSAGAGGRLVRGIAMKKKKLE